MGILDAEDASPVRIKGDRTVITADELDSNRCAFNSGIDVQGKVVTLLLIRIATESGVASHVLQGTVNPVSFDRNAGLQVVKLLTEERDAIGNGVIYSQAY